MTAHRRVAATKIFREEALERHARRERPVVRPIRIGGRWLALLWALAVMLVLATTAVVVLVGSRLPGAGG